MMKSTHLKSCLVALSAVVALSAAAVMSVVLPAAAGTVRDDVSVTLVPDSAGRFDAARVESRMWFEGLGVEDRAVVRRMGRWMPAQAVLIGPDGMPLPVALDLQAKTLRWSLPAGSAGPFTLRFVVDDAIAESGRGNRLDFDWLRWPDRTVTAQQVMVLFPQGFVPQDLVSTWDDVPDARPVRRVALGVEALQIDSSAPPRRPLQIGFTPKLASVSLAWYLLVALSAVLALLTGVRLLRIPGIGHRDRRDPTPAELAYLLGGDDAALLVAHLDLELQQRLIRGGRHFHTRTPEGVSEGFHQLLTAYYQEPRPLDALFRLDNPHRHAFIDALLLSMQQKGLWRDLHPRTDAALDLVGYWIACAMPIFLTVVGLDAWSQAWMHPWLQGAAVLALLFFGLPLVLLRGGALTPLARAQLRKYHILLSEGMHHQDPVHGARRQLAYGAALVGLHWLQGALPEDQVAVYRSAGQVDEGDGLPKTLSLSDLTPVSQ